MDFYYISMIQTGKRPTIDVINHQRNMRTPVVDERRCRGRGEASRQTWPAESEDEVYDEVLGRTDVVLQARSTASYGGL